MAGYVSRNGAYNSTMFNRVPFNAALLSPCLQLMAELSIIDTAVFDLVFRTTETIQSDDTLYNHPYRPLNNIISITDLIIRHYDLFLDEEIEIVDTIKFAIQVVLQEAIVVSAVKYLAVNKPLDETIGLEDAVENTLQRILSENITITDQIRFDVTKILTSLLNIQDAYVHNIVKQLSEDIGLLDFIEKTVYLPLIDGGSIDDDPVFHATKYLTDNITIVGALRNVYEILLDEGIDITSQLVFAVTKRVNEMLNIQDVFDKTTVYLREYDESIDINDLLSTQGIKSMNETINITDLTSKIASVITGERISFLRDDDECLVAAWDHSDGSGPTVTDRSRYSNHMTQHGALWEGPFGETNRLRYDGLSDYSVVPHDASLTATPTNLWSMETWIYPTALTATRTIIRKGQTDGYALLIRDNKLTSEFHWDDATYTAREQGTLLDSAWNHVVVTYDGTTRRHYINAVEVGAWVESKTLDFTTTAPLYMGSNFPLGSQRYRGEISLTRLRCLHLTAQDVAGRYVDGYPKIDSDRRYMTPEKRLAETVSITDAFITKYFLLLDELITLTPALTLSATRRGDETIDTSDEKTMGIYKVLQRTIQVIDILIRSFGLTLDEELSVIDTYRNHTSLPKTEALTVADDGLFFDTTKRLQESILVFDTLIQFLYLTLDEDVTLDSTLSLTATLRGSEFASIIDSVEKLTLKKLDENPTVSDVFRILYELLMDEAIVVTDVRSMNPFTLLFEDSVSLDDGIVLAATKLLDDSFILSDVMSRLFELALDETLNIAGNRVLSARKVLEGMLGVADDVSRSTRKEMAAVLNIEDTLYLQLTRLLSESFNIAPELYLTATKNLNESGALIDDLYKVVVKQLDGVIGVLDVNQLFTSFLAALDESINVVDQIVRFDISKVLTDNIVLLDNDARIGFFLVFAEMLTLEDEHIMSFTKALEENIGFVDLFGRLFELVLSETLTITDLKTAAVTTARGETITIIDAIEKVMVKPFLETLGAVDETVRFAVLKYLNDNINLTDSLGSIGFFRKLSEFLDIEDAFDRTVDYTRLFTEAIDINDLSPFLPIEGDEQSLLRLYFILELQAFAVREYGAQGLQSGGFGGDDGVRPAQLS